MSETSLLGPCTDDLNRSKCISLYSMTYPQISLQNGSPFKAKFEKKLLERMRFVLNALDHPYLGSTVEFHLIWTCFLGPTGRDLKSRSEYWMLATIYVELEMTMDRV